MKQQPHRRGSLPWFVGTKQTSQNHNNDSKTAAPDARHRRTTRCVVAPSQQSSHSPLFSASNSPTMLSTDLVITADESDIKDKEVVSALQKISKEHGNIESKKKVMDLIPSVKEKLIPACPVEHRAQLQATIAVTESFKTRPSAQDAGTACHSLGMIFFKWKATNRSTRSFPSCLEDTQKDKKEAVTALADHCEHALDATILSKKKKIGGMEFTNPPDGELRRKCGFNISSNPIDEAHNTCPFCKHSGTTDAPKTNDANQICNGEVIHNHNVLSEHVKAQLAKPDTSAIKVGEMVHKKAPTNPTVKNGKLRPILFRCCCAEIENLGGDSDTHCVKCKNDLSFIDSSGVSSCPVCNCSCKRAWLAENFQAIFDWASLDQSHGAELARQQTMKALESQSQLGKLAANVGRNATVSLESALKARGSLNAPPHALAHAKTDATERLAREVNANLTSGVDGQFCGLVQNMQHTITPSPHILFQDPVAHPNQKPLDLRQMSKPKKKGMKGHNNGLNVPAKASNKKKKKTNSLHFDTQPHTKPPSFAGHKIPSCFQTKDTSSSEDPSIDGSLTDDQRKALGLGTPIDHFDSKPAAKPSASATPKPGDVVDITHNSPSEEDNEIIWAIELSKKDTQCIHSEEKADIDKALKRSLSEDDDILSVGSDDDEDHIQMWDRLGNSLMSPLVAAASKLPPVETPTGKAVKRLKVCAWKGANDTTTNEEEQLQNCQLCDQISTNPDDVRVFIQATGLHENLFSSPVGLKICGEQLKHMERLEKLSKSKKKT